MENTLSKQSEKKSKVRSLFISDTHLGSKFSHAEDLYDFLKQYKKIDYLFLIGDIIDGWQLQRRWYWNDTYNNILRKILGLSKHGTQVVYIAGNHDEFMDNYFHLNDFGNIKVVNEYIHTLENGKKVLLIHGDEFDYITGKLRWLSLLGDVGYTFLLLLNKWIDYVRRLFGFRKKWSFSNFAKQQVKKAANYISDFEELIKRYTVQKECDAVICGHIHTPKHIVYEEVEYWNCGDWMESNSAIIEKKNGELELIRDYAKNANGQREYWKQKKERLKENNGIFTTE
jgi:UDP-2,3-diacylglucosamine pyrophosphatase LpxH